MEAKVSKLEWGGLFGGVALCILVLNLPLTGLAKDGKMCLALSLMAIVWWATKAMPTGFSSLALLVCYILFLDAKTAPPSLVFGIFTSPIVYLVISGFLIAEAVSKCGLGKRIALHFVKRFIRSYQGVIVSCYLLGLLLSFMIPHPWPRSFLLLSVMGYVITAAGLDKKWASNIGLAIFAGSVPTSMVLLTGDSSLNSLVAGLADTSLSWMQWLVYMGVPGLLSTVLLCLLQLKLFGAPENFYLDKSYVEKQIVDIGKMSSGEKTCIAVLAGAIILWMTDTLHGIHPGWVAVMAVVVMSMPFFKMLTVQSFAVVNMGTLLFLAAALAIGNVGRATGMNEWIVSAVMPARVSSNPFVFALLACSICMVIHMFLGSTLAVMSITAPIIITIGQEAGISAIVCAMVTYVSVCQHWALPFHHMNMLVGCGAENAGYTEKDTLKLGLPQTVVVFIVCMFSVFWWKLTGLL